MGSTSGDGIEDVLAPLFAACQTRNSIARALDRAEAMCATEQAFEKLPSNVRSRTTLLHMRAVVSAIKERAKPDRQSIEITASGIRFRLMLASMLSNISAERQRRKLDAVRQRCQLQHSFDGLPEWAVRGMTRAEMLDIVNCWPVPKAPTTPPPLELVKCNPLPPSAQPAKSALRRRGASVDATNKRIVWADLPMTHVGADAPALKKLKSIPSFKGERDLWDTERGQTYVTCDVCEMDRLKPDGSLVRDGRSNCSQFAIDRWVCKSCMPSGASSSSSESSDS